MASSLRILVVGVSSPVETFIERLLRGLAGKGVRITFASEKNAVKRWMNELTIDLLSAPRWRGFGLPAVRHLLFHSLRILLTARRDGGILWRATASSKNWRDRLAMFYEVAPFAGKRWDLVYFPWNLAAVNYLPLFELGMPVLISCRGSQISAAPHNPRRAGIVPGLQETFAKAAAVHCVSQDILEEAQALGLDPDKARVIHPAVEANFFHPNKRSYASDGVFRVVTTGSLGWVKGFEYALLATHILKHNGVPVQYEIIGDGPERERVLFTIQDLDLGDCVCLAGRLSPEQVRVHLQNADVFLLSSLSEGISNAALEAMACGLPIVTTNCGGMREAVTDGVEGYIVPIRNPQKMAGAMEKLWSNPELRKTMGEAARARIQREFRLDQQIDSFLEVCQVSIAAYTGK